ncbi:tRNA threonylcarbamoyladenosine biosynthesis protein TsaB [Herbinix hemicellulosilytica]|uniref:Gcp-like domain-containing protein n=1 Tax=Herbinix hemicellulosilytica TaxID=1564487 RepID=A0A0H5SL03_HERHM|nr:tRNA (adenosine(37)-N6)-threonylcarbamoyltransferase complex dimerization subunit type 1 TsaB [Herbinix hemicellulosilytica]RBP56911.1 tRNA threonylcarbamoyladenosine biosynthesis protein TsaB [Herbinix hemicellulosilytica]CRZ35451.1 hypothetical protein HHT355_2262 [Herbinix hemicellulosilytica]
MIILALDSSGLVASVAVASEEALLAEYTFNYKKTHSQTLLPMLDEVVRMLDLDLADIDAIAVTAGPGSFTGLRIGSATAKGLGLALKKPIVSVPTLDCMAYNLYGTDMLICPMMDARRDQIYTGLYEFSNDEFKVITPQKAVSIDEIIEEVNKTGRKTVFLGDGVPVHKEKITRQITTEYVFAPVHMNRQRAGSLAALGIEYFKAGRIESAADHQPVYLRMSQAERERAERLKRENENNTDNI